MINALHFANNAKRKSGLYECTRDQIFYERKCGINSQLAFYEQEKVSKDWIDDGWLKPVDWSWAKNANLFIVHRGIPGEVLKKFPNTKKIMVVHGTADFLILDEIVSKGDRQNINVHINLINSTNASVAVNRHDYEIYKYYDRDDKLSLIHDAIDTDKFSLKGYKHPYLNHPQIIYADSLRINKNPAHIIWAMPEIFKTIPNARLTIFGLKLNSILTWRNFILRSAGQRLNSMIENIQLETTELRPYYRGADILYNGNFSGIPSRVEMEAMACGCQVISSNGDFSKFHFKAYDIKSIAKAFCDCWEYIKKDPKKARQEARRYALKHFSMEKKVKNEYISLYHRVLEDKK